jgi:hypothetical protein
MQIQEIAGFLDRADALHLARLLILISSFEEESKPAIEGITKLAKLDFLLRYPTYFEKAMVARGVSLSKIVVQDFERKTVESQMVRFKYGPWDHRLRGHLNILAARGLVQLSIDGRTVLISCTDAGKQAAQRISENEGYMLIHQRAQELKRHLDIGATQLMRFIYETFPEIASLKYDEGIAP